MSDADRGVGQNPVERRGARVTMEAQATLRRPGQNGHRVRIFDISPQGARLEFVERPSLDERNWVKFDGLEAIEAVVCWIDGHVAGLEFARPIHPAVFDALVARLAASG